MEYSSVVSMSYRRRMFAGNSLLEILSGSRNNDSCFVNFRKESVKSVVSEISNFKINLLASRIITIKLLSDNFTKSEHINGYFYKGST